MFLMCSEDINVHYTRNYMGMSSQLHAPAVLRSEKVLPVTSEYEAGWAEESDVMTKGRNIRTCSHWQSKPSYQARNKLHFRLNYWNDTFPEIIF
jgi:hypothetical protein